MITADGKRQPNGQWCWCPEPPKGQEPHDCAEDHHMRRTQCQADGAHVHPWPSMRPRMTRTRYGSVPGGEKS